MNSIPSSPPLPATPCADSRPAARPSVGAFLVWSAVFAGTGIAAASGHPWLQGVLYLVGVALGVVLTCVGFDFASAYRRLFVARDAGPVHGQLWLLAATLLLFAPVLALGEGWGLTVKPSVAPLTLSIVAGAFLFGVGMQLAGGCSAGSLYALGGGNARMGVVLVFFCIGALMASLHIGQWDRLPSAAPIVLGESLGWGWSVLLQLGVLVALGAWLSRKVPSAPTAAAAPRRYRLWGGPWPLWAGVVGLSLLNLATLVLAGHPWNITWAHALWGAKAATLIGWDPTTSAFWQDPLPASALGGGLLDDVTSMMNIAMVIGAAGATLAARRWRPSQSRRPGPWLAAVFGGLLMGYGARIAFGCNIGAFLAGVASSSLHGWLWIASALPGIWLGIQLRPRFGLTEDC